jgi:predicted nucleotidyltransferase
MTSSSLPQQFAAALDGLIAQVKDDRSILAAILCGSLAHDTVWRKSDIDLVLVTVDGVPLDPSGFALNADGVNVHASLMTRTQFRRIVEGAVHNSFMHSLLAKGRLLYAHDESVADLCGRLQALGERDIELQLLRAATNALGPIDKAHKWMLTRGDLDYASLWILYAATPLAQVEVFSAKLLADREVIPQAMTLNPTFFRVIYTDLLNTPKTRPRVQAALDAVDGYVAARAPALFKPLLDHLRDTGEARSATEIDRHFERHCGLGGVTTACEYLADRGLVAKVSTPVHLTRKSHVAVQELAFVWTEVPRDRAAPARARPAARARRAHR